MLFWYLYFVYTENQNRTAPPKKIFFSRSILVSNLNRVSSLRLFWLMLHNVLMLQQRKSMSMYAQNQTDTEVMMELTWAPLQTSQIHCVLTVKSFLLWRTQKKKSFTVDKCFSTTTCKYVMPCGSATCKIRSSYLVYLQKGKRNPDSIFFSI